MTSSRIGCPILGFPDSLNNYILPTNGDVLRYWKHLITAETKPGIIPKRHDLMMKISNEVSEIWSSASIPAISPFAIERKLGRLIDKYRSLLKSRKINQSRQKFINKQSEFDNELSQIFDIALCNCINLTACTCTKEKKVPSMEHKFLIDQRGKRQMMISSVDSKVTTRNLKKYLKCSEAARKVAKERKAKQNREQCNVVTSYVADDLEPDNIDIEDSTDPNFEPDPNDVTKNTSCSYNTNSLPNLASVCDRTGVSSRKAAILASAVLENLGVINPSMDSNIIDKNKLNRERSKSRSKKIENAAKRIRFNDSRGLYFDGKKDETLHRAVKSGVKRIVKELEEHYTLIIEPNTIYKGHVNPKSGTALDIASAISDKMGPVMKDISVLGCDGTNINVGKKGGIIRLIEQKEKRAMQWAICLLHMNELPLRHLVKRIGGYTSGPKSFVGPLGKQLANVE